MRKRQKFVTNSVVLSLGFISLLTVPDQFKVIGVGLLSLATVILFTWSLWGGLQLDSTVLTLVLPVFFTVGVGLFWFLLPTNVITGSIVILIYAIGMYALSLTANIYTVSAIRTIALLRSARGVGFVLTMVVSFLVFDAILSLRTEMWFVALSVFAVSFLLYLQSLWSISLDRKLKNEILLISTVSAYATSQVSVMLYFWPVTVVVGSLFLTTTLYVLTGLGQAQTEGRLFSATVREYLTLAAAVFVGMFITTIWSG